MAQIYVWHATDIDPVRAGHRFSEALARRAADATAAYGRQCTIHVRCVGPIWIGSVTADLGLLGYEPWIERGPRGVAWAGVCEEALGVSWNEDAIAAAVDTLVDHPERTSGWRGGWSAVAWNETARHVAVVTGTSQSQTLWQTHGPFGWAVGSRARPLTDLVGRQPELDGIEASLFLSFGYLAGPGSLLRGVERLDPRRQVEFRMGRPPIERVHTDLANLLAADAPPTASVEGIAATCAESYADRIARQLRYSANPVLSLTGGRDSRSIAAALSRTSFRGPARTSGRPGSEDVTVARRVAEAVGFEHVHDVSSVDPLARLHRNRAAAVAWSRRNEGVETIRHALYYDELFDPHASWSEEPSQSFNGLRPFLNRRDAPAWQRDALLAKAGGELTHRNEVRERFLAGAGEVDAAVAALGGSPEAFADLHFWQVKVLHAGQDNVLTKDMFSHWWTPMVDVELIRANWHLPTHELPRAAFVESLTRALEPRLTALSYAGRRVSRLEKVLNRVRRRLPAPLRPARPTSFAVSPERRALWDAVLLEREPVVWPDLIDRTYVRRVADANPSAHLLWSLATVELFAEAQLGVSDPQVGAYRGRARLGSP